MNALLYLVLCFFTGYVICSFALPQFQSMTKTTFRGSFIGLNPKFITLPISFLTGTVVVTWTVYLLANLFRNTNEPLIYANTIALCSFLIFSVLGIWKLYLKNKRSEEFKEETYGKIGLKEGIFLGLIIFLSCQLMWTTFFIEHNQLYVGRTVFSDFSPHVGMIRSFSKGNNFPTMYSHFTGADIKYHFMYLFLVGNLEFLGLRLDWAMNLPSAIGLISSFLLLFVLAVKMSGKRAVGYLSCLFFAFRSSKSLFTLLAKIPKGESIFKALTSYNSFSGNFIGYTTNEDWGLWNLNVYCNQRHLAFTIPMLLFIITLFLPSVYASFTGLYEGFKQIERNEDVLNGSLTAARVKFFFQHSFFRYNVWRIKHLAPAIFAGIMVGALAFWNGAVTITILLILFVLAITAQQKLEYLITAIIALLLSMLQSWIFIEGTAIKPDFKFGFIAENKTLFGTIDYILRLTGILPLVLILAFFVVKKARRYVMIAYLAPFLFAFTYSLTTDVTVNHKYIMLSVMLLSIYAAIFLVKLFGAKSISLKVVTILLILAMTATGIYDYFTILAKNNPKNAMVLDLQNELTEWVIQNTSAKDTFLSSNYALNYVVLGGGMLYCGWQYFGWSAGYDTPGRDAMTKKMFEADTPELLKQLIDQNDIRFIIVDKDCRDNEAYEVNEANIEATYQAVYEEGSGEYKRTIYDTKLLAKE